MEAIDPCEPAIDMPRAPAARVMKVGGSLFHDFELLSNLRAWLHLQPSVPTLVVVGGGELADAVRALDQRFGMTAQSAHAQAIHAMRVNAFVLSQLWSGSIWIERLADWQRQQVTSQHPVGVLDPLPLLSHRSPRTGPPLPCGWHVTSDSIAAQVASELNATELVLLKSTLPADPPAMLSCEQAAAEGLVDAYFPIAARTLRLIRAVNLRDPAWPQVRLSR